MSSENDTRICRACLKLDECKYYELKESKRYFTDFLKIEFDGLSTYWLCFSCHYRIKKALNFSDKVQTANSVFYDVFNKMHHMSTIELVTATHIAIGFPKLEVDHQIEKASSYHYSHDQLQLEMNIKLESYASDLEQDDNINYDSETNAQDEGPVEAGLNGSKTIVVVQLNQAEREREFQSRRSRARYVKAIYRCELCYVGFRFQDSFMAHMMKHSKTLGDFECDMCHQRCPTERRLKIHHLTHSTLYKCSRCMYRKASKTSILDHYKLHHSKEDLSQESDGRLDAQSQNVDIKDELSEPLQELEVKVPKVDDKIIKVNLNEEEEMEMFEKQALQKRYIEAIYKCKLCYKGFLYKDTYLVHLEKHSKFSGKFECVICHIFVPTERKLKLHRANHAKMYRCALCDYARFDRRTVEIHFGASHTPSDADELTSLRRKRTKVKVECGHCGRCYATRDTLVMHIRRKHMNPENSPSERPYACNDCGKRFRFHHDVKIHASVHLQKRDYYCVECDFYFKTPYALSNHLKYTKKHLNADHFIKCPLCPSTVINKQELKRHTERVHVRAYAFRCDACPKAYCQRNDLNRHVKRSHGDAPRQRTNVCDVCGKSFLHKKTLVVHMNVHTGDRPYKCGLCAATFVYPGALYTHNQLVHLKVKRSCDLRKLRGSKGPAIASLGTEK